MKKIEANVMFLFSIILLSACNDEDNAINITKKLSINEKLNILSGPGFSTLDYTPNLGINTIYPLSGIAGYINGINNHSINIPSVKLVDGPAGVRINPKNGYATAWPIGSLLASTWNKDIVKQVGIAVGNETKLYGADILLAPGMNIQRNPLNGRNFEYYSEDPLLTGEIGASMVSGIQSNGVGATIKHFFGNESESNRLFVNVIATPRALREIYLRGFKIAIKESKPWAVMTSYNKVNGKYVNQRKDALTNILRDEWQYDGLVMSDWFAGNVAPLDSNFKPTQSYDYRAAATMIKAGNNLIEPGDVVNDLKKSYLSGYLKEAEIDKSVIRILTMMQKTYSYHHYEPPKNPDLKSHMLLAEKASEEGIILLKNNNVLPINVNTKIALFGTNQFNTYKGGTGSGDVNSLKTVDIIDGLKKELNIFKPLSDFYFSYFNKNKKNVSSGLTLIPHYICTEPNTSDNLALDKLIVESSIVNDIAIISIGRISGEGVDRTNTKGDYQLSDSEFNLIKKVSKIYHKLGKKVVVILNVGGIIDVASWRDYVDGIILAYMGGNTTGTSITNIMIGKVNPSGKLAQTIPLHYSDVPSSKTFPGQDIDGDGAVDQIEYNDNIFVGYRYYSTFNIPVAYPFGYGLSYTNFDIFNSKIIGNTLNDKKNKGNLTISTNVSNDGEKQGKEVVQVYIKAPQNTLKKPLFELKAFSKTLNLSPGQVENIILNIPAERLASFDEKNNQWIIDSGNYDVYISNSSNINNIQPVRFKIDKKIVISNTTPNILNKINS